MAVYVFCCNAQSKSHSDPRNICMLSLFYQFPNYNLFTQHVLFILWRDTTLWTPVQFPSHCYHLFTLLALFTILAYYYCFSLDTLIPLFIANRWDWEPHRKLGAKYLVVLCAGSTLLLVQGKALDEAPYKLSGAIAKLASITFWSLAFSYWIDKPKFLTEGKFSSVLIIPSSWGSQLGGYMPASSIIFWRHCRGKRRLLQGEFCTHILYFVLVLLYFTFACIVLSKTQKISFLIVVNSLLLVHHVVR
jgi:hypothetical protein